ncbi:MAG TPA: hypothetical protein VIM48_09060 [Chthoniobacterales bacterium]
MKRTSPILGVLFAMFTLLTSAEARTFPDFTEFRGHVQGTLTLIAIGSTFPGSGKVSVIVPRSGRSATFNISGSVTASGTTLPLSNMLTFSSSKSFTAQDLLFHLGGGATTSASGQYSSSKRNINYSARFVFGGSSGTVSGTIRTHQSKTKKTLEITYILKLDSSPATYQFNITASRRIK